MFLTVIMETDIFRLFYEFLLKQSYRDKVMNIYNDYNFITCLGKLLKEAWVSFNWSFDYVNIWGTNIFQIVPPFLAIVSAISYTNIKQQYDIKIMVNHSCKISLSVFIGYCLFYSLMSILSQHVYSPTIIRSLFIDILGEKFYFNHIYIYYLLDGSIRFFVIPFIYSLSGNLLISTLLDNKKCVYFIIFYYFIGTFICNVLTYLIGPFGIYLNPTTIMISGAYTHINTILLLMTSFIPLIISVVLYKINILNHKKKMNYMKIFMIIYLFSIVLFGILNINKSVTWEITYYNVSLMIVYIFTAFFMSYDRLQQKKESSNNKIINDLKEIFKSNIQLIILIIFVNMVVFTLFNIDFKMSSLLWNSIQLLMILTIIVLFAYCFVSFLRSKNCNELNGYLILILFCFAYIFAYFYNDNLRLFNIYFCYLERCKMLPTILRTIIYGCILLIMLYILYRRKKKKVKIC